jgi:hypothetical protein
VEKLSGVMSDEEIAQFARLEMAERVKSMLA